MGILDALQTLFETLRGQVINVPTDSWLGYLYVIVNIILLLAASLGGTGS